MPRNFRRFAVALAAVVLNGLLAGCSQLLFWEPVPLGSDSMAAAEMPDWGPPTILVSAREAIDPEGAYRLDAGDRLRIFIYGHPNLSRLYTVDHQGMVPVPLIGDVPARGKTTKGLANSIAARLGAKYVKEPQVTVDIAQYRPFFILGEVRSAGQYPYVSGMTVQAAVAIAGGYADRADERRVQITRRINGIIEKMDVPPDYVILPGDTLYIYERWL
jgi:polysaccharide biosynthesis/export protein